MIFFADEGVDREIVVRLREAGYEVLYGAEISPAAPDSEVLSTARQKKAVLITSDKDFGELVHRQGMLHTGIVLLRLDGFSSEQKAGLLLAVVKEHGPKLAGAFGVVSPGLFRKRSEIEL